SPVLTHALRMRVRSSSVASVSRATSSRIGDLLRVPMIAPPARPAGLGRGDGVGWRAPGRATMLGVVATLKVKPGKEQEFEAVAKKLVAKVVAGEPGCKLYALHHAETPGTYVFMERYVDQGAVEAHRATDYFKTLGRKMGEFMDGRAEILRLREVE